MYAGLTKFLMLMKDRNAYLNEIELIKSFVDTSKSFPDQVFGPEFQDYAFFNFDSIFTETFFESLVNILHRAKETAFTLVSLLPEPESYFFRHFESYPLFRASADLSAKEYLSTVFADPGGSPADALAYNSTELIIHSNAQDWCIYGNRDFEIGIFAATKKNVLSLWQEAYQPIFDAHGAVENILKPAWGHSEVPPEYIVQFLSNYDR